MKTYLIIALVLVLLIVGLSYFLRNVWFYRDPQRKAPTQPGSVISPADGQVMYVKPIRDGRLETVKLGERIELDEISAMPGVRGDGWLVGIYMSPLDVHFNYSPVDCRVLDAAATKAKVNLPMVDFWEYLRMVWLRRTVDLFARRFHLENERRTLLLEGKRGKIVVVEIADKFVNKIKPFVSVGDELKAGEKIGFIERGSQVDLAVMDPAFRVEVKPGQQVYGAKTIIGTYPPIGDNR